MSETIFTFNNLSKEEALQYFKKAYMFSVSRNELHDLQIIENKFEQEDLGACAEKIDIFWIDNNDIYPVDNVLDKGRYFASVTETGSGKYMVDLLVKELELQGAKVDGLLFITRTMSNYKLDAVKNKIESIIYKFCSDELNSFLDKNICIWGEMARAKLNLTDNFISELRAHYKEQFEIGKISRYIFDERIKTLDDYVINGNKDK